MQARYIMSKQQKNPFLDVNLCQTYFLDTMLHIKSSYGC